MTLELWAARTDAEVMLLVHVIGVISKDPPSLIDARDGAALRYSLEVFGIQFVSPTLRLLEDC